MKKGLDELAEKISELVNTLPNDGEERQISVTIGGDNHGNITFGNHITINTASAPQKEERALTDVELRSLEANARREQRAAFMRSYFNLPLALMVMVSIAVITSLVSGYLWAIVSMTSHPWTVPAIFAAVFLPLAFWARRIIELEQPILQEAKATLEYARQMRHRRRVM